MFAIDTLKQTLEDWKKFFLPIKIGRLALLGVLTSLSKNTSSGGFSGNFNYSGGGNSGGSSGKNTDFSMLKPLLPFLMMFLGIIIGVIVVWELVWSFIGSIFLFSLIDTVWTSKKAYISFAFGKHVRKGSKIFGYSLLISIISLGVLAIAAWPFIKVFYMNNWSMTGLTILSFPWWTLFISIPILFVIFFIITILNFIVYNFAVLHMFKNESKLSFAIQTGIQVYKKNLLEVFVFWLMSGLVSFGISIIVGVAIVLIAIPLVLIVIAIFFLSKLAAIIIGTIFIAALYLAGILLISPLVRYFLLRYQINMYQKLISKK